MLLLAPRDPPHYLPHRPGCSATSSRLLSTPAACGFRQLGCKPGEMWEFPGSGLHAEERGDFGCFSSCSAGALTFASATPAVGSLGVGHGGSKKKNFEHNLLTSLLVTLEKKKKRKKML